MKKLLSVVLASIFMLSLVACSGSDDKTSEIKEETKVADTTTKEAIDSEESEQYTIAWVDGNLANESNAVCTTAAEEHAKSLNVDFILLDGEGSGEKQVSQIENLIEQKVDCIIVQPYDAAACQVGVEAAIDAGINVLVTKTTIEDNSVCPFVGQDDVIAGEMEMQWIADQLGGKGNIVIIEGPTGISAAIDRNDGIQNVLKSYPDIEVLYTQTANWNRDEGMNLMENWLQTGKEINAVVAHNDEMALGAYDAVVDAGKDGEIIVIGIDAIDAAKQSVSEGKLDATVLQDVETIGQQTIDVALAMCKGEDFDMVYDVDPILLTQDNIGDYVK